MTASAGDTSNSPLAAHKAALRRELRGRRIAIVGPTRTRAAEAAANRLLSVLRRRTRKTRHIAVYLSARSELSTVPLIAALQRLGVGIYVPMTRRNHGMAFVPMSGDPPLRRSSLGLQQPVSMRGARAAGSLDVIVLPLLGFDAAGHRLGNGGGYYDRALAQLHGPVRPLLVGYGFAAQQIDEVPIEPWDMPLDAVVTERAILRFRPHHHRPAPFSARAERR